jgi:radical SAM protein with 4Fe4S-binding SPASM domain
MCNIWQVGVSDELAPHDWSNIPQALRDINISGGEPFLRDDLAEIVRTVRGRCPRARIILSTNGIDTERIRRQLGEMLRTGLDVGIGISIDGTGRVHDETRGYEGAYEQALRTIRVVKELGLQDIRIAFTAMDSNVHQIGDVYGLSRELGVQFSCVVAHDSDVYFRTSGLRLESLGVLREQLNEVATRELRSLAAKRWLRAYFYSGLYAFAQGGRRVLPCMSGESSIFIDPTGSVFPCNVLDMEMGSIRGQKFEDLWNAGKAAEVRRKVQGCRRPCWMMCSARSSIRKHPLKAGLWVVSKKLAVHLARRGVI